MNRRMIVLFAVFVTVLAAYLWGNVTNPSLCFDPAQFIFTVLGLEVGSPPFSGPGTLADAFRLNLVRNLDPGGFTLMSRYWAHVSTNPIWLRLLSVSFLVIAIVFIYRTGKLLLRDRYLALLLSLLPLTNQVIAEWSLFPRAYGMEVCGIAWLALLCYCERWLATRQSFVVVIATMTFFATSRYSYLLAVAAFALAWTITERDWKRLLAFGIPFLPAVLPLFLHHAQENRDYIGAFVLAGKSSDEVLDLVRVNLSSIEAWFQAVFFLIYLLHRRASGRSRHRRFFWFLLILNLSFIPPSLLGIYPWKITERFTISLNVLSYVALISSLSMILSALRSSKIRLRLNAPSFLVLSAILAVTVSAFRFDPYSDALEAHQLARSEGRTSGKGYVSPAIFMESKYLFEFGALRGNPEYPLKILTASAEELSEPYLDQLDYAIVGKSDPWAVEAFSKRSDFVRGKPFYHLEYFVRR